MKFEFLWRRRAFAFSSLSFLFLFFFGRLKETRGVASFLLRRFSFLQEESGKKFFSSREELLSKLCLNFTVLAVLIAQGYVVAAKENRSKTFCV